jgi:hypothetical protein
VVHTANHRDRVDNIHLQDKPSPTSAIKRHTDLCCPDSLPADMVDLTDLEPVAADQAWFGFQEHHASPEDG